MAAAETPVVTADGLARVAFDRSTVETMSPEGRGQLTVASAGLRRPPTGSLMAPLESLHQSSPFGLRTNPLTGAEGEPHWGQDYAAACGTRVYSADAGMVRAVGWHPWGGGNRVEVDHGNGLVTTYNHLEAIAVKKGNPVQAGEIIARVGTTGSSTGCHLHFETIVNGSHIDPLRYTLLPVRPVDPIDRITMTSYVPDAGKTSNRQLGWAIPVHSGHKHGVSGGVQERPGASAAAPSAAKRAPKPAAPSSSPGKPPSVTPTPAGKSPSVTPPAGKSPSVTPPAGKSSPGKSPSVTPTPPGKSQSAKAATDPSSTGSPPATPTSRLPRTEPAPATTSPAISEPKP